MAKFDMQTYARLKNDVTAAEAVLSEARKHLYAYRETCPHTDEVPIWYNSNWGQIDCKRCGRFLREVFLNGEEVHHPREPMKVAS